MTSSLWLLIGAIALTGLLGAVFFGAPYVPTRRQDVLRLFRIISRDDVLVDLGSGDGRLMVAAAQRGMRVYGVELSPLLALICWLRTRRYRELANVRMGNYWHQKLPDDTTVVFVFLSELYMERLGKYLDREAARLGRPLTLVSYGFEMPGRKRQGRDGAMQIYRIEP